MHISADDAKKFAEAASQAHEKAGDRWTFGLPIANGAALIAIGGGILSSPSEANVALLLPAAWMFVLGVAAGGVVPLLASRRAYIASREWYDVWIALSQGKAVPAPDPKLDETSKRFYFWEWRLEFLSALMFVGGLSYPLAVFAIRYLSVGRFLP